MFLIVILVMTVFTFLGFLRATYLRQLHGIDSPVWSFVLVTSLLFLGLYLSSEMVLMPIVPAVKDAVKTLSKKISIMVNDSRITALEKRVEKIEAVLKEKLHGRLTMISGSKNNESKIDALYRETVEAAKNANINKRTDGVVPKCFSDPTPPLKHYTDDINI
jgi:hypothetical protein